MKRLLNNRAGVLWACIFFGWWGGEFYGYWIRPDINPYFGGLIVLAAMFLPVAIATRIADYWRSNPEGKS